MNPQYEYKEPTRWDDVVFDKRNKEYGSYSIRKLYSRHTLIGSMVSLILVGMILGYPSLAALFEKRGVVDEPLKTIRYTDLAPPPPIDKNTPPPPKLDMPPPVKKIIKFLPPKVTDKEVPEEEKMKTIEELKQTEIGPVQQDGSGDITFDEPVHDIVDGGEGDQNQIFTVVEQMPEPEGGLEEVMRFINKNVKYPGTPKRLGIEGTVFIGFVIDKDGTITDVQTVKGVHLDLDKEALRVIKLLKPWKPGKQNGKPVRVKFVLPIRFKMST